MLLHSWSKGSRDGTQDTSLSSAFFKRLLTLCTALTGTLLHSHRRHAFAQELVAG